MVKLVGIAGVGLVGKLLAAYRLLTATAIFSATIWQRHIDRLDAAAPWSGRSRRYAWDHWRKARMFREGEVNHRAGEGVLYCEFKGTAHEHHLRNNR